MQKSSANNKKYLRSVLPFNIFVWLLLGLYLMPVLSMIATALMSTDQLSDRSAPLYPARLVQYTYNSKQYPIYNVPTENGIQQWALVAHAAKTSGFIDPQHPEAGVITLPGNWKKLQGVYEFHVSWENFQAIFSGVPFNVMLRNTLTLTLIGEAGVLVSSIIVAYGFARFYLPGGNLLFYILIATILIPDKVTFFPTYLVFTQYLHWGGTFYPLLAPLFFGNAVYIFLLRQNFKSIPIDLEEAAMIDGAGPLQRLFKVVLPQSWPVVVTVSLLHFFYTWNETRLASLYLASNTTLTPLSFGVQNFQSRVPIQNIIQASTIVVLIVPVLILFIAQKFFLQGMVITGTER